MYWFLHLATLGCDLAIQCGVCVTGIPGGLILLSKFCYRNRLSLSPLLLMPHLFLPPFLPLLSHCPHQNCSGQVKTISSRIILGNMLFFCFQIVCLTQGCFRFRTFSHRRAGFTFCVTHLPSLDLELVVVLPAIKNDRTIHDWVQLLHGVARLAILRIFCPEAGTFFGAYYIKAHHARKFFKSKNISIVIDGYAVRTDSATRNITLDQLIMASRTFSSHIILTIFFY